MRKLLVAVALLGLVACGNDKPNDNASATTTTEATVATTTTTATFGSTAVSTPENSEQGVLVGVKVGKHDGFSRVVFEFENLVPGYAVKKAEPPFTQDGSGKEVTVSTKDWLTVRLTARAHREDGTATVSTKPFDGAGGGTVEEVALLGDFEGVVNFVIGTSDTGGFRVFSLASPPRLVVDIAVAPGG